MRATDLTVGAKPAVAVTVGDVDAAQPAIGRRDPVTDLDHSTDFSCLDLSAKVFNFLLEN